MDQLLYGVRTDTFSWEALNQPIACVLVPGSQQMVIYNLVTYMQGHKEYSTRDFLAEQSHDGGRSWSCNVPLHVESFKSDNAQTG
ncbi:hypothetical protein YC2023_040026 [Brassica napus]